MRSVGFGTLLRQRGRPSQSDGESFVRETSLGWECCWFDRRSRAQETLAWSSFDVLKVPPFPKKTIRNSISTSYILGTWYALRMGPYVRYAMDVCPLHRPAAGSGSI